MLLPIRGEDELYDKVIRLHVVANSDEEYDQNLKLKVRDAVIVYAAELVGDCETRDQAIELLSENRAKINEIAQDCLASEGYAYPVSVSFEEEHYPTKSYESVCFPAGKYLSMRISIGEAEGKNWWCVLFPQLCLSAATGSVRESNEGAFIEAGFTQEQYRIITETENVKYKIRFKILETVGELFGA
jgi:stage II sporulation protein R